MLAGAGERKAAPSADNQRPVLLAWRASSGSAASSATCSPRRPPPWSKLTSRLRRGNSSGCLWSRRVSAPSCSLLLCLCSSYAVLLVVLLAPLVLVLLLVLLALFALPVHLVLLLGGLLLLNRRFFVRLQLDTPSLYVDLDAVESNIGVMSEQIRSTGAVWRPHTKAIRSPALAQMLVDGGAVGVTCAKITQAAALVAAGIKDVLIANEIVGPIKVANLVELSKSCDRLTVAVDNADNLRAISAEAVTQDAQMSVLVDLNIGMNRCGIHWSKQDEIVMMAQLATDLPNIEFMGLMCALPHPQT